MLVGRSQELANAQESGRMLQSSLEQLRARCLQLESDVQAMRAENDSLSEETRQRDAELLLEKEPPSHAGTSKYSAQDPAIIESASLEAGSQLCQFPQEVDTLLAALQAQQREADDLMRKAKCLGNEKSRLQGAILMAKGQLMESVLSCDNPRCVERSEKKAGRETAENEGVR